MDIKDNKSVVIGSTISFENAPCKGLTRLFYSTTEMVQQAKNICETCSYKKDCINFAIKTKQNDGVWGGVNFSNYRELKAFKKALKKYAEK
jgi:hypothetical protein